MENNTENSEEIILEINYNVEVQHIISLNTTQAKEILT